MCVSIPVILQLQVPVICQKNRHQIREKICNVITNLNLDWFISVFHKYRLIYISDH